MCFLCSVMLMNLYIEYLHMFCIHRVALYIELFYVNISLVFTLMPYTQAISIRTLFRPIVNLFGYLDTETDMNLSCKDVDNYVYTHAV